MIQKSTKTNQKTRTKENKKSEQKQQCTNRTKQTNTKTNKKRTKRKTKQKEALVPLAYSCSIIIIIVNVLRPYPLSAPNPAQWKYQYLRIKSVIC